MFKVFAVLVLVLLLVIATGAPTISADPVTLRQVTRCYPTGGVLNLETVEDTGDYYVDGHPRTWLDRIRTFSYNPALGQLIETTTWYFDHSTPAHFPNGGGWRLREIMKTVGVVTHFAIVDGYPVGVPGTLRFVVAGYQNDNPTPFVFMAYDNGNDWYIVRTDDQTGPTYQGCAIHVLERYLGYCYQQNRTEYIEWRLPPLYAPAVSPLTHEPLDYDHYPTECLPVNNLF